MWIVLPGNLLVFLLWSMQSEMKKIKHSAENQCDWIRILNFHIFNIGVAKFANPVPKRKMTFSEYVDQVDWRKHVDSRL